MRNHIEPDFPSQPTDVRTYFNGDGCHIHGHPSTGGILIKHSADLVDLLYLSLPRLKPTSRSADAADEDAFCERLRRLGASWWQDEATFLRAFHGKEAYDEDRYLPHERPASMVNEAANEKRARRNLIVGWLADGVGVWISRRQHVRHWYAMSGSGQRLRFALSMEERIMVMQESGAEFVEDAEMVRELNEPWSEDVYEYYTEEEEDDGSDSSASEYYEGDSPSCI
jgi:hypothetical protein